MNLNEAIELIRFENKRFSPQRWLDLGCGSGLFTIALASQLPASSIIIAVDRDKKSISKIPASYLDVTIEVRLADFINDDLQIKDVDGILMANSLHYVKNKEIFLDKLIPSMKKDASFLLVEYDRITANAWVPFPLTMELANDLFKRFGYHNLQVIGKRSSVYGRHEMYAAVVSKG